MGLSPFSSCGTNYYPAEKNTPPPNPDPSRWVLLEKIQYNNAYVLLVRYLDCTNFEGVKVMVFPGQYRPRNTMDPHFSKDELSPIARFRPDKKGIEMAKSCARNL